MLEKRPRIRLPQHLAAAKGEPCSRCGRQDGTVVACHYSGVYAHRLGKGVSTKPHDFATADLCYQCHTDFDQYQGGNGDARAAEFMICILLTLERRFRAGQLRWVGENAMGIRAMKKLHKGSILEVEE